MPARPFPYLAAPSRRSVLLAGASLVSIVAAAGPALAGGPPMFSPGWYAQNGVAGGGRAGGSGAATGGANGSAANLGQIQAKAAQQTSDLARAAQAIRAAQAAQAATHQSAVSNPSFSVNSLPPVTDGLGGNGLVVDPRVVSSQFANTPLWQGAAPVTAQSQTVANGQTNVTINQTAPQAVLTWQNFNVGAHTSLTFNQQGNSSWVALNRVDATTRPSQILGNVKADGTILVINPNGIIFGAGSQVNVHSLVASALDINGNAAPNGNANLGVFNAKGDYVPVTVNGTAVVLADGTPLLAPANELNADQQFVSLGLFASNAANNSGTAIFSLGNQTLASRGGGAVIVEPGASITATGDALDSGYVALLGPTVSNAGSITSIFGQTILAAGSNIFLTTPPNNATGAGTAIAVSEFQPSVSVGPSFTPAAIPGGSLVVNAASGFLQANDGNVTMVGDAVQQAGTVSATTSVSRTGSITLTASGTVTFGPGSVTAILPDESGGTIPTSSVPSFLGPQININTLNLDMQGGSLIEAPGAAVTVTTSTHSGATTANGTVLFEPGSTIDVAGLSNVSIPISDDFVSILVTANEVADDPLAKGLIGQTITIDARLGGTLPDGRVWIGSPLLDAAGFVNAIPQSIDELLTTGGSVNIGGGNVPFLNVIQAPGAAINVSGGSIQYQGGTVGTTFVQSGNGSISAIGSADPTLLYTGLAGQFQVQHPRWGVTQTFNDPLIKESGEQFVQGYTDGMSAGGISIAAANPVLDGSILASTDAGSRQRQLAQTGPQSLGAQLGSDPLPSGAALSINVAPIDPTTNTINSVTLQSKSDSSNITGLSFTDIAADASIGVTGPVVLSTELLSAADLGSITIGGSLGLSMAAGASLAVQPGGSITLKNVTTIDGTLTAPSGQINISGFSQSGTVQQSPPSTAVTIGPDAVLDVHGLFVNDAGLAPDAIVGSAFINGGTVSISTAATSFVTDRGSNDGGNTEIFTAADTTQSIVLAPGSLIDVSSGAYVQPSGALKVAADGLPAGQGGSVSLETYTGGFNAPGKGPIIATGLTGSQSALNGSQIYQLQSAAGQPVNLTPTGPNDPDQASVALDGTIKAEGFDGGGTFTLQVPSIQIGGSTSIVSGSGHAGQVTLPTSFFLDNAFSKYALTSTFGSVVVTPGTVLTLQQSNYLLPGFGNTVLSGPSPQGTAGGILPRNEPNGTSVDAFASIGIVADGLRHPVDLTLVEQPFGFGLATDPSAGAGLTISAGAQINADPQAAITLVAGGQVTILGSITAPGGSITALNALPQDNLNLKSQAPQDVWVGPDATLNVAGIFLPDPLVSGFNTGTVLNGGSITLGGSTVVVQQGAQLDLAGASATIEEPNPAAAMQGPAFIPQAIWSNGGTLALGGNGSGLGSIYFAGTVDAAGGAPLAAGGAFVLGNMPVFGDAAQFLPSIVSNSDLPGLSAPPTILLQQSGNVAAAFTAPPASGSALTAMLQSAQGVSGKTAPAGIAAITADMLNGSGFSSVTLNGALDVAGSVTVALRGALVINGNITLLPTGSTLPPAELPASIGATTVTLDASYIGLDMGLNDSGTNGGISRSATDLANSDGTLDLGGTVGGISAQQIDLSGSIEIAGARTVNITSDGDIRLLAAANPAPVGSGTPTASGTQFPAALQVPFDLNLTAHQIYPATDTAFLLQAGNSITISSNGAASTPPISANGEIILDAPTINQDGTLHAPFGTIQIGVGAGQALPSIFGSAAAIATETATLGAGSLTSVSGAGINVPFGYTIDGTSLFEDATFSASAPANPDPLAAPPAKLISLAGADLTAAPGAVLDASGGGTIFATEFVPGTGGSRNVLATFEPNITAASGSATSFTPQFANGQQVFALVPSYEAPVAPYDPTFANFYQSGVSVPGSTKGFDTSQVTPTNAIAPGSSVFLAGGNGIPAGSYTLLPGMYATLPGAFRIVQATGPLNPAAAKSFTTADGSQFIAGFASNALTGARSALPSYFEVQSAATWQATSQINITDLSNFFTTQAANAGTAVPQLPRDAGQLSIAATKSLTLLGSNAFAPAAGGRGGEVDISAQDILVLAPDQRAPAADEGFLVLDSDQISALGVQSVLIGGRRSDISTGIGLTAIATNVEIDTDAAHPLTGPELLLAALAPPSADPSAKGITVDAGSVIAAIGTVSPGTDANITIGTPAVTTTSGGQSVTTPASGGDGALLRVSNGAPVTITRNETAGQLAAPLGSLSIGAGASIKGGVALALDSSGNVVLPSDVVLAAQNFDIAGSAVNLGNVPAGTQGVTLSSDLLAQFAGAQTVTLLSRSVFNFFDEGGLAIGDPAHPIGVLTLDGAGLFSAGGNTTITAQNIVLQDSQATPALQGAVAGSGGALTLDALASSAASTGAITLGNGALAMGGVDQVTLIAGQQIVFAGNGSTDTGAASVQLTAPVITTAQSSTQALTTTGTIAIAQGAGTAPSIGVDNAGGALTLTAAAITDAGTIAVPAGTLTLEAKTGDIVLAAGASISAPGIGTPFFTETLDVPGGFVHLLADQGNVTVNAGATIDVSGAGSGAGGTLVVTTAPTGTATLAGTFDAAVAAGAQGAQFSLDTGRLAGTLPQSFTGSIEVETRIGDLDVSTPLSASTITLTADGGAVNVATTLDASGTQGGMIGLFGAGGVDIKPGARLLANATGAGQTGGLIELGTTGSWDGSTLNADGSEAFTAAGLLQVETGAVLDVSGGAGGIGGSVLVRTPLLASNDVNVQINGKVSGASSVVLDAFHTWSTTDPVASAGTHFDGIVDPAGWFNADGQMVDGVWEDIINGQVTTIATETNGVRTAATGITDTNTGFFVPNAIDQAHETFYQTTLLNFVQNAGAGLDLASHFASVDPTLLALQPEIVLQNPSSAINGGSITVASNWNLGAGAIDGGGNIHLLYRTGSGQPGTVTFQAANNVQINASISDGFFQAGSEPFFVPPPPPPPPPPVGLETFATASADWLDAFDSAENIVSVLEAYMSSTSTNIYQLLNLNGAGDLATFGLQAFDSTQVTAGQSAQALAQGTFSVLSLTPAQQNAILAAYAFNAANPGNSAALLEPLAPVNLSGVAGISQFSASAYYRLFFEQGYLQTNYAKFVAATTPILRSGVVYAVGNGAGPIPTGPLANYPFYGSPLPTAPGLSGSDFVTYYKSYAAFTTTNYANNGPPTTFLGFFPALGAYNHYYGTSYHIPRLAAPAALPLSPGANAALYLDSTAPGGATSYSTVYSNYLTATARTEADPIPFHPSVTAKNDTCVQCWVPMPPAAAPSFQAANAANLLPPPPPPPAPPFLPPTNASPSNAIANNPSLSNNGSVPTADYNTTASANLLPAGAGGSFSFGFVAGADFGSANPHAVMAAATGGTSTSPVESVTIDGHTQYADLQQPFVASSIEIPTLVRTGTGSIDIAAAGSVEFLDKIAPGAIYTAGTAAPATPGFNPPTVPANPTANGRPGGTPVLPNGLVSDPVWADGGGNVSISAGKDIIGIETPTDPDGSETGKAGTFTGQMWSSWFYYGGQSTSDAITPFAGGTQTSSWINYATFFQGIGALGGGNVSLKAGGNIDDISASLPETLQVSGGVSAGAPPVEHFFGGGNLSVQAGGNLLSSAFLVGRGTGTITAGGVVAADPSNPITGAATAITSTQAGVATTTALPLLLAVEDGFVTVDARQSVILGGIFDPTTLPLDTFRTFPSALPMSGGAFGSVFDSFGPDSGVAVNSLVGNVTLDTLPPLGGSSGNIFSLFIQGGSANTASIDGASANQAIASGVAPATIEASSLLGSVATANPLALIPSATGTLTLIAGKDVDLASPTGQTGNLQMIDGDAQGFVSPLGLPVPILTAPLHAGDTKPVEILAGHDIDDTNTSVTLIKAATIEAGHDIENLQLIGQNNADSDITSVIAGNDITGGGTSNASMFTLYGPGVFYLQAGHDIGPISQSIAPGSANSSTDGIATIGNGSDALGTNVGTSGVVRSPKSYLPAQGASIDLLFGVGHGVDYQAAISQFVNPTQAGTDGIDFLGDIASILDQSRAQAWASFQALPAMQQQLLVQRAFLDTLTQVAQDSKNPASQFFGQSNRAYEAINTLFPAALGYTNNLTGTGAANGAATTVETGNLVLSRSVIETQMGGDINLIGPGGSITVGSNTRDNLGQSQQGILTEGGGTIRAFADGSINLGQSRILTAQGGDIDLFSANGDIQAGEGPKTLVSDPPVQLICTPFGVCVINPSGLVSGAGIAALVTLPGQDPGLSNVTLAAPRGTIDAGAAGIRSAGNLNLAALHLLNTFNVQAGGTIVGIPQAPHVDVAALSNASAVAADSSQIATELANQRRTAPTGQTLPSIIVVEVLGFGEPDDDQKKRLLNQQQSYDTTSPVQVIGGGVLSAEQRQALTDRERRKLDE
ncbi:MAG TPA: filamentous hemagglutinin family protein [Aliidongia sp.]|nr:filamentous hemagglutinin family protein [Aliidongia sp.]